MRREYEMTQTDLAELLKASEPVPLIMLQCGMPRSQQERANDAWAKLGRKMGFLPMSVRPVPGKGQRCFTAETPPPIEDETGGGDS